MGGWYGARTQLRSGGAVEEAATCSGLRTAKALRSAPRLTPHSHTSAAMAGAPRHVAFPARCLPAARGPTACPLRAPERAEATDGARRY